MWSLLLFNKFSNGCTRQTSSRIKLDSYHKKKEKKINQYKFTPPKPLQVIIQLLVCFLLVCLFLCFVDLDNLSNQTITKLKELKNILELIFLKIQSQSGNSFHEISIGHFYLVYSNKVFTEIKILTEVERKSKPTDRHIDKTTRILACQICLVSKYYFHITRNKTDQTLLMSTRLFYDLVR